jgi:uncharacterized LabA/DUF88 family protein
MAEKKMHIAYIDAANVDKSMQNHLHWKLDYARFKIFLKEKYGVERAYIFIGLVPAYKKLYTYLSNAGFSLVFKDVVYHNGSNIPKGNCDADLIVQAMEDYYEGVLDQAVLVTSDGDYAPLVKKLFENNSLRTVFSPSPPQKCSILLKRTGVKISYIHDQRRILERE